MDKTKKAKLRPVYRKPDDTEDIYIYYSGKFYIVTV